MTITAVGAVQQDGDSGSVSSLSVAMGSLAIGDYLVLGSIALATSPPFPYVYSVAGGGVPASGPGSWTKMAGANYDETNRDVEIWVGKIASLTPDVVTVDYNNFAGGFTVDTARIACQQFHSSIGNLTLAAEGAETSDTLGDQATGTYFNLNGIGLYFACGLFNTPVSGSTSGFTYVNGIGGGTGGAVVWNASAAGLQAPGWDQGSSGNFGTCSILMIEVSPSSAQQVMIS